MQHNKIEVLDSSIRFLEIEQAHFRQTARQLPDLSTSIRVRSALTDGSRLRGALPIVDDPPTRAVKTGNDDYSPSACVDNRTSPLMIQLRSRKR
jgi:hypothetical protein